VTPVRPTGTSPARSGAAAAALPAITAALAALLSCGRPGPPAPASERPPVQVRSARVGGVGEGWVEVPGSVEAARTAGLASRFSAVVEIAPVEEGDAVSAGQVLLRLDGRDLRARLEAAEAALRAARAQRDRVRALFERDAATRQELDAAEAADSAALAERDAARAQLDYIEIRAPFAGRVTDKRIRVGDLAVPGQPLLVVQGGGALRVAASVSREQADRLKIGGTVEAVLEDGGVVQARVSVLNVAGDPASRRFLVKADLPAGAGARAGAFARLRVPRGEEEPRPIVPARALIERGSLSGVFVIEEGRARLRWIDVGERAGDAWVVRAGLRPGEEVILDPSDLRDGDPVQVAP
jgi:RND family efflux transporter MFP subunit